MKKDFLQEIFDKIAKHLLTQNKQSKDEKGHCFYRGPDGLKCAVGAIIPDKDYDMKFEGLAVGDTPIKTFFIDSGYSNKEILLLKELQIIHDAGRPSCWKNRLSDLALKYSLSSEILDLQIK